MQVAKNDSVIRATAPSGYSPVRLAPAVGVTTGAHYRMSNGHSSPAQIANLRGPRTLDRTAKPIVRPKGDKNSLSRSGDSNKPVKTGKESEDDNRDNNSYLAFARTNYYRDTNIVPRQGI